MAEEWEQNRYTSAVRYITLHYITDFECGLSKKKLLGPQIKALVTTKAQKDKTV